MWTTPAATEMRFGFEVTMYVMNKRAFLFLILLKINPSFCSDRGLSGF
ncbi:MAG: PqqA family [Pseudomonadota bacterium]